MPVRQYLNKLYGFYLVNNFENIEFEDVIQDFVLIKCERLNLKSCILFIYWAYK